MSTSSVKLTIKQENFCLEYSVSGNASDAYRKAYNSVGMKEATINVTASKMLNDPKIATRVQELRAPVIARAGMSLERVLLEIERIATFDIRKMYDVDGKPIPIHLLDDDTAAAVAALDIVEEFEGGEDGRKLIGYTKKYKTNSKNDALTMAMRYHGAFNDKLNVNVIDDLADRMARARNKLK